MFPFLADDYIVIDKQDNDNHFHFIFNDNDYHFGCQSTN